MDTLADVLARFAGLGYVDDLVPATGGAVCFESGAVVSVDEIVVDEIVRLEGDSDPDDELIVYAVTCTTCSRRGVFIAKFGADTSADETALIHALASRHA